jgi:hypothetical protein
VRTKFVGLLAASLACNSPPAAPVEPDGGKRIESVDRELTPEQRAFLARLEQRAAQHPEDFTAQKAAGIAHMQFTLSGVLSLQEQAETYLEAAFALDPTDEELTRSLGRFYNMRAVDGDYSKAEMQVEVYAAHLGQYDPHQLESAEFVAYSFLKLGEILTLRNRGNLLGALADIKAFEALIAERVQRFPDDIEMVALAGNFEFFFAGNVPMNKRERVAAAVRYFEVLRERWADLRPGAKHETHCPNTYENFMFELAEGYLVLERPEDAKRIYEELSQPTQPLTRAKEQIAWVSKERLRNVDAYVGKMELMPPWPSDGANCVVCHSWSADVSLESLYSTEPVDLRAIPSAAQSKPVP